MKLLITGGAGFIGTNFAHYWANKYPQDTLIVLDALTYAGHKQNLSSLFKKSNFQFIHGDICDFSTVSKLCHQVDTVVHFAAETHVDRSLAGLQATHLFNRTNIKGTITLLEAATKAKVSRFHHISTDEVYGDLPYDQPRQKFHENFPYSPTSPYSISKASSDFYARFYFHTHNLPVTISNCTNNYGPYQTPEKMIPRSLLLLLNGQKIQLYTSDPRHPGQNVRDWLHVTDHCRAIDLILKKGQPGQTYCIGGNTEVSNLDLVTAILHHASTILKQGFSFNTHVELVADRPGHDRRYAMDTTKIKHQLHWQPQFDFQTGLKQTIKWYTSPSGRRWLKSMKKTSQAVRPHQDKKLSK